MKKFSFLFATLASLFTVSCSTPTSSDDITNPVIKDKNYPEAFWHNNSKTVVISPYRPYNLIDVKGIKPGHLSRDISTAKKDSNGKLIVSTAKIFKVPEYKPAAN